jgi:hypothetical protein
MDDDLSERHLLHCAFKHYVTDSRYLSPIESCFYLANGVMDDDLSEQHLLDCAFNHYVTDSRYL